ncbi:MAG: hypothetical protein AAGI07_15865, partial [Bacteroidota bacterium]
MQSSYDLYLLVKSLTKAEKRHFKLQSSLQKGKKDYMVLFDTLDSLSLKEDTASNYDEEVLRGKIKDKLNLKHLHVTKNYLATQVLKSLRTLREESDTESKLNKMVSEIKVLADKGTYRLLSQKLKSAKNLALQYEKYNVLIDLLNFETVLCVRHKEFKINEVLEKLYDDIFKYLDLMKMETAYKAVQNEVTTIYRKNIRARNEKSTAKIQILENNPLLKTTKQPPTFLSKVSYNYSKALLFQLNGNLSQAIKFHKEVQDIWIGYPHFKKEYPMLYMIYSSNYLVGAHLLRDYSVFPTVLDNLTSLPKRNYNEEAEAFQNICYLEQLYFMNKVIFNNKLNTTDVASSLAKKIETGLDKYHSRIVKSRQMSFCINSSIMFFALNMFDESLAWMAKIHQ